MVHIFKNLKKLKKNQNQKTKYNVWALLKYSFEQLNWKRQFGASYGNLNVNQVLDAT